MAQFYLLMILCMVLVVVMAKYNFCHHNCEEEDHILCMRKKLNCSPDLEVCNEVKQEYFKLKFRQDMLDVYNQVRNEVALGELGYPTAANMKALRWCFELEYIAQCIVNTCSLPGDIYTCIRTRNYNVKRIGQIYNGHMIEEKERFYEYVKTNFLESKEDITEDYIDFNANYKESGLPRFDRFACSQIDSLGCGLINYINKDGYKQHFYICCFAGAPLPSVSCPANYPVYIRGEPCSRCGDRKCNTKYPGLCGESLPIERERGVRYRREDIVGVLSTASSHHEGLALWLLLILVLILVNN